MTIMADSLSGPMQASNVMCRNMMSGPTVIAYDAQRHYEVIFAGKGDPDGEDIQAIPEALMRSIAFQRALRQGVLSVTEGEDHPVVQAAMARQSDRFRQRMAADELAAREVLDAVHADDLIGVNCIGPGSREGAVCGELVPLKDKDQLTRPPLCDRHQHLSDFCVKRGSAPWALEREALA